MEWVETTAKSVEEAKNLALDKLGVDESEAEFDVLEEPKQGLFGRVRGEARVRARVVPKTPRAKDERRDRKRRPRNNKPKGQSGSQQSGNQQSGNQQSGNQQSGKGGGRGKSSSDRAATASDGSEKGNRDRNRGRDRKRADRPKVEDAPMEEVIASVEGFLAGLTEAFDIETQVSVAQDGDNLMASIEGKHGLLLGPKARTLDAIQELTRVTAQRSAPSGARIKVDVGGYREARSEALASFAGQAAERAIADGREVVLEPMSSADRKTVHDSLTDVAGVSTRSAGNDPRRRVVVVPDVGDGDNGGAEPEGSDSLADVPDSGDVAAE